jgi:hypothetical protein
LPISKDKVVIDLKNLTLFLIVCFAFVLLTSGAVYSNRVIIIEIPGSEITVSSDEVLLGDIAEISGCESGMKQRIENIFVARAPKPGQHIRVSRESISAMIGRAGFDRSQFNLQSPPFVRLVPTTTVVRTGDFVKAAQSFLVEKKMWTPEMRTVSFNQHPPRNIPAGNLRFDCTINDRDDNTNGVYRVAVTATVEGRPVETREIVFISGRKTETARNTTPAKNLNPEADNNNEITVKRGDTLKVQFIRKNMVVEVEGTAAEQGSPGDNIRVTVNSTRKTFNARLRDGQTAVIEM